MLRPLFKVNYKGILYKKTQYVFMNWKELKNYLINEPWGKPVLEYLEDDLGGWDNIRKDWGGTKDQDKNINHFYGLDKNLRDTGKESQWLTYLTNLVRNYPLKIVVLHLALVESYLWTDATKITIDLLHKLYIKNKEIKNIIDSIPTPPKTDHIEYYNLIMNLGEIEESHKLNNREKRFFDLYSKSLDQLKEAVDNYLSHFNNYPQNISSPGTATKSAHELIIADLFLILDINFEEQKKYPLWQNSHCFTYGPIVDFLIEQNWFEVFGIHGEGVSINNKDCDYQSRRKEKIDNIAPLLWLDAPTSLPHPKQRSLLLYTNLLENNVQSNSGNNIFKGISQQLEKKVPLLSHVGLDLCMSYIEYLNKSNDLINRPAINFYFRQAENKTAISLDEIESTISQKYKSSYLWSNEEKVALYFKTFNNIYKHIGEKNYKFPQTENWYKKVANNWYNRSKK